MATCECVVQGCDWIMRKNLNFYNGVKVCVNQPFPAGGFGGRREPPSGSGAEPRRQTHFGNNLLKSGLKQVSGLPSIHQRAGAQNSWFLFEVT